MKSLQSPVVNHHVGNARTGKGFASSHSVSTQQDKSILELIMDLITKIINNSIISWFMNDSFSNSLYWCRIATIWAQNQANR